MSDALTEEAEKSGEKKALVFDIQRFCLHDGPGIRTVLFFKGCALRCAWCHNPESHQARQEVAFFAQIAINLESLDNGICPGRIDQYLYPYYRTSLKDPSFVRARMR